MRPNDYPNPYYVDPNPYTGEPDGEPPDYAKMRREEAARVLAASVEDAEAVAKVA